MRSAFSRTAMNNTHLTYHHKKNINIAVVFLSSLVISVLLTAIFIIASLQNEQVKLQKIAHFYGDHFSQKISTSLQSLSRNLTPLYTMLILHDGRTDHFERVAEHIAHTNPEIININLARNGIVTNVYPYERNKIALGHNLLEAEQRRQEARLARDSRRITLSGPFQLVQGARGSPFVSRSTSPRRKIRSRNNSGDLSSSPTVSRKFFSNKWTLPCRISTCLPAEALHGPCGAPIRLAASRSPCSPQKHL